PTLYRRNSRGPRPELSGQKTEGQRPVCPFHLSRFTFHAPRNTPLLTILSRANFSVPPALSSFSAAPAKLSSPAIPGSWIGGATHLFARAAFSPGAWPKKSKTSFSLSRDSRKTAPCRIPFSAKTPPTATPPTPRFGLPWSVRNSLL